MIQPRPVVYPEEDGKPMSETEFHGEQLSQLVYKARVLLRDQRDHTHVAGNQLFYWVEGDNTKSFSPDVYVMRGVPQRPPRRIWKLWEGGSLDFVIELSSPASWRRDIGYKVELYEMLGVYEYVVFDVLSESSMPQLQMWRLQNGVLQPLPGETFESEVLGARLVANGWHLDVVGPDGAVVLGPEQDVAAARRKSEALEQEAAAHAARAAEAERRIDVAQARIRALEAELAQRKPDGD